MNGFQLEGMICFVLIHDFIIQNHLHFGIFVCMCMCIYRPYVYAYIYDTHTHTHPFIYYQRSKPFVGKSRVASHFFNNLGPKI